MLLESTVASRGLLEDSPPDFPLRFFVQLSVGNSGCPCKVFGNLLAESDFSFQEPVFMFASGFFPFEFFPIIF